MIGLVDANNFFASCEVVFRPDYRGRALIVRGLNDGCVIARSAEAKALGIKMAQPVHEIAPAVRRQLIECSANYPLYCDMSRRIVTILREAVPRQETYSVDESFCEIPRVDDVVAWSHALRDRIRRWTGIPTCVGISAGSKTLAKAANRLAKRGSGVVDLSTRPAQDQGLAALDVEDVWGVGRRWAAKLNAMGVRTAADLRDAPASMIQAKFGVVLARTQRELQGHSCSDLVEHAADQQQIMVSRSFGDRIEDATAVAQAIAGFAEFACEKLRRRSLETSVLWIFASTDPFRPELRQHHPSRSTQLPLPTNDTRVILNTVRLLLKGFFRPGMAYKRAGVALMELGRSSARQGDLFMPSTAGNPDLMAVLDTINQKFGRGTAGFGATGWARSPAWAPRQRDLSPRYTTRLSDLPLARC